MEDDGQERDENDCVPWCPVRLLDAQAGPRPVSGSARNGRPSRAQPESIFGGPRPQGTLHNDTGSASRFFPVFWPDAPDIDADIEEGDYAPMAEHTGPADTPQPEAGQGALHDRVICGDSREVLAGMETASVDAIVTDPPYALTSGKNSTKGFMSAAWDNGKVAHDPAFWAEVLRVAKPGAHLVAFGGDRTAHRLAVAIEDAGWTIRGSLYWVHSQGFPKNLNVTRAIESLVGADALCACALRSTQRARGFQGDCLEYRRSDGEQPHLAGDSDPGVPPSPGGAHEHSRADQHADGQDEESTSTAPGEGSARLSSAHSPPRGSHLPSGVCPDHDSTQCDTPSSMSPSHETVGHTRASRRRGRSHWDADSEFSSFPSLGRGYEHIPHCSTCGGLVVPQGIGTALKPACEPIVLARKPLAEPTVAANVLAHGTGALHIDACRVPSAGEHQRAYQPTHHARGVYNAQHGFMPTNAAGRWPSNFVLSHIGGPDGCRPAGVRRVKGAGWRDSDVGPPDKIGGAVYSGGTLGARGTGHHTDADGYESVDAWTCVENCPVRLLDEQAGPRTSGGRTHYPGEVSHGNWRVHEGRSDTHRHGSAYERASSSGPVHRFFPTFAPEPEDAVPYFYCPLCEGILAPEHAIMRETHSEDALSCPPGSPHAPALSAVLATDPRPDGNGSVRGSAAAPIPPNLEDSSPSKDRRARSAARSSGNGPATTGPIVPDTAPTSLAPKIARAVQSVVGLCDKCATAIAHGLVALRLSREPASVPGWASIPEHKRPILRHSLALLADSLGDTGIIPTTASLKMWSGYVQNAMPASTASGAVVCASDPSVLAPQPTASPSSADATKIAVPWVYIPKASRSERNAGLEGMPVAGSRPLGLSQWTGQSNGSGQTMGPSAPQANGHPTVKPLALARWLTRLVAAPGSVVLDPFCGSGSLSVAAVLEGCHYIAIDAEERYCAIARARIAWAQQQRHGPLFANADAEAEKDA